MANHVRPHVNKDALLDIGKLQTLQDPLLLRVVKIKGNVEQPIELPAKEGLPPGAGWTRDEVLSLENWLLTKWSGGGYYRVNVVDARGVEMFWTFMLDPRTWPERIPPNTSEASNMASTTPPTAGPQPVPSSSSPIGSSGPSNWPPSGQSMGYGAPPQSSGPMLPFPVQQAPQFTQPQAAFQPQFQPQFTPPNPWGAAPNPWGGIPGPQGWPYTVTQPGYPPMGFGYPGYPQVAPPGYPQNPNQREPRAREDDSFARRQRERDEEREQKDKDAQVQRDKETRELESRLRQAELEKKELEYKQQLERQQQAHTTQMQMLQDEIRRVGEGGGKKEDEEVRRLREDAQRSRDAHLAEQAAGAQRAFEQQMINQRQAMEAQLNAQRLASEQQMMMLKEQLVRMAEKAAEKPTGESDEIRRLREAQEHQRQEAVLAKQDNDRRMETERAERERDRERFERERRDEAFQRELKTQEETRARRDETLQREMKEQREAFERRLEVMSQTNRASDPVIEMMKETTRMRAEETREIARMQQDQTARMATFMVPPLQMMQMVKDQSSGSDGLVKNVVDSLGGIVNMYRNAAEQVMQMSGGQGDPPAARLIQEGMAKGGELAEHYFALKRDQVIGENQVKKAQAQAETAKIQAQTQAQAVAIAARQNAQRAAAVQNQGAQWAAPPQVVSSNNIQAVAPGVAAAVAATQSVSTVAAPNGGGNGLGGHVTGRHTAPVAATSTVATPTVKRPSVTANGAHPLAADEVAPDPSPFKGPTEEEIFGMALPSVQRLRVGVAEGKLEPEQAIDAILKGVEQISIQQLNIPAFSLFEEDRYADFIDILLPNAPGDYKAECVRILAEDIETETVDDDDNDPVINTDPDIHIVPNEVS
jgi:hypothetical protein